VQPAPKTEPAGGVVTAPRRVIEFPALLPADLSPDITDPGPDGRRPRSVRDWLVDATCFLIAVGFGSLLMIGQSSSPGSSDAMMVVDVALGVACCLALWWRRRWPVGLAVVTTASGAVSASAGMAVTIMAFTVAVHRRARTAIAIAAANIAVVPVFGLIRGWSGSPAWVDLLIGVLITLMALGWGMLVRSRRQLVLSLRDRAVRAESEQQLRVEQARRLERARIAREMHDVLAHRISLLSVHAGALEFRPDVSREQVAEAAGVIRATAHQALQDLREVIGVLREDDAPLGAPSTGGRDGDRNGAPEPPQPGLAEIPALIGESTAAGARIEYLAELADPQSVPGNLARTAYRVVQEGLTNARKHAPGTPIEVSLTGGRGRGLVVQVANPVPARTATTDVPGAGLGLIGLAERVQLAGGELDCGPESDRRFVLRARLPWPT
jgi:signal transduction histidine kinase